MMFKLVIFLFFVCFLSVGNPLKLKSLCNERVTKDGTHKVNSYYKIKFEADLPPISHYLPEMFGQFDSRMSSFVQEFKKHVKEIYCEQFMNSTDLTEKIREQQESLNSLKSKYSERRNYQDRVPPQMLLYIDQLDDLLNNMTKLSENNATVTFLPPDRLRSKLALLAEEGLDANQTSTLKDYFLDVFYEKQLVTLDGFRLKRGIHSIFLDESAYGVVHFSLYLPMHDGNKSQNIKSNCSCTDYLPKFFLVATIPTPRNRTSSEESD